LTEESIKNEKNLIENEMARKKKCFWKITKQDFIFIGLLIIILGLLIILTNFSVWVGSIVAIVGLAVFWYGIRK